MSTGDIELPPGWARATIGELIPSEGIFIDGDWVESKDQDPDGDVRLIQLADIGDGTFQDKSARFLTTDKARELNCTFLEKGDLLIARMPDPLGRCCIFPLHGIENFVTVVDVCAVRLGTASANPRYLMHLINSPQVRGKISELQSGSTRKRISRGNLATIQIAIAPRPEQDRIVAKIEELFSELDSGVESLKTARRQLKVCRQALLKHAFEGGLTADWRNSHLEKLETSEVLLARIRSERDVRYTKALNEWQHAIAERQSGSDGGRRPPKPASPEVRGDPEIPNALAARCTDHWPWLRLGDISEVSGGLTKNPKRSKLPVTMKYLRVANVYADRLDLDDVSEIGVSEDEFQNLKLEHGDLLVVEGNGSVDQIGRVAVWGGQVEDVGHQNHLIRVRLIEGMSPRFFLSFLMSPLGRDLIVRKASSTSGLHTLSISKVAGLPVPVPSADEQEAILAALAAPLSELQKIAEEVELGLSRCAALRQSILKKAFSGRLVSQEPSDEPASVLLERIKAQKEESPKRNKNNKKEAA